MDKRRMLIGKTAIAIAVAGIILLVFAVLTEFPYRIGLLTLLCAGALWVMQHPTLRSFSFTAWVLVCVGFALAYPQTLQQWGGFRSNEL